MCIRDSSSALAILHLLKNSGLDAGAVDYVIDCGEEACGDMNQRGGCNLAKAAAEVAGLVSATGSDVRAFCAAPAHAMISGAALDVYKRQAPGRPRRRAPGRTGRKPEAGRPRPLWPAR